MNRIFPSTIFGAFGVFSFTEITNKSAPRKPNKTPYTFLLLIFSPRNMEESTNIIIGTRVAKIPLFTGVES